MLSGGAMRIIFGLLLVLSGAPRPAQALEPGDTISISVYQDPKLDRKVLIGPSGMISFPLAGQIRAGGMTPAALETVLKSKLKDKFTEEPDITVSLVAGHSGKAGGGGFKAKDIHYRRGTQAGLFHRENETYVMQAVAMAGGFGPYAAKRRIQVRRQINGTEVMFLFDYVAFHSGRNVEDNIDLLPGDVVIIPERGIFEFEYRVDVGSMAVRKVLIAAIICAGLVLLVARSADISLTSQISQSAEFNSNYFLADQSAGPNNVSNQHNQGRRDRANSHQIVCLALRISAIKLISGPGVADFIVTPALNKGARVALEHTEKQTFYNFAASWRQQQAAPLQLAQTGIATIGGFITTTVLQGGINTSAQCKRHVKLAEQLDIDHVYYTGFCAIH